MRTLGCFILLALIVVVGYFFLQSWQSVTPWGVGTGNIGGRSADLPARDQRPAPQKAKSAIAQITTDPTRFQNQRRTVSGRVYGAGRMASNRNIYKLIDGDDSIVVIDDKAPPKPYEPRTVSGIVKTIGPPIGGLNHAYLVDIKQGVKFTPPSWHEVKGFFGEKLTEVKTGVKDVTKH